MSHIVHSGYAFATTLRPVCSNSRTDTCILYARDSLSETRRRRDLSIHLLADFSPTIQTCMACFILNGWLSWRPDGGFLVRLVDNTGRRARVSDLAPEDRIPGPLC